MYFFMANCAVQLHGAAIRVVGADAPWPSSEAHGRVGNQVPLGALRMPNKGHRLRARGRGSPTPLASRKAHCGRSTVFIIIAMALFAAALAFRMYRTGGYSLAMVLLIAVPAAVMFLFIAPSRFGVDDPARPTFEPSSDVGGAQANPAESARAPGQQPYRVDPSASEKWGSR